MDADHDRENQAAAPRGASAGGWDAAWRQEIIRLDELGVVSQAHRIVAAAKHADLADALVAARHRVVAARQRLARARADGDAGAIAAAAAAVEDARRAAEMLAGGSPTSSGRRPRSRCGPSRT